MGVFQEFKTFVQQGNVLDLAVGVVIGAAFGKIVSSLVADVITPVIGLVAGGVNFTALKIRIGGSEQAPVTLNYGNFLQTIFDFLIIALAIFMLIKTINSLKKKEELPATAPTKSEELLTEIRDLLKKRNT